MSLEQYKRSRSRPTLLLHNHYYN